MAIGRTARGTATTVGAATLTLAAVTVAAGSTLVVGLMYNNGPLPPDDLTWGAYSLTERAALPGATGELRVYTLENCAGGTEDLVADFASAGSTGKAAIVAVEVTGAHTVSFDQAQVAAGSSTTPSSGAAATTARAKEMLLGFIGTEGPSGDTPPTWSDSFSTGQRAGTTGAPAGLNSTLAEGYRAVTATGAYTAAATGITSRQWIAAIVTLKEAYVSVTISPAAAAAEASAGAGTKRRYPAASVGADPGDIMPAAAAYASASIGVRSPGPYFAMWMKNPLPASQVPPGQYWDGDLLQEQTLSVQLSLHAPPVRHHADDEPHWLATLNSAEYGNYLAIGVTPDLRICAYYALLSDLVILSPPGVVPADGQQHQISFSTAWPSLSLDGAVVFEGGAGPLTNPYATWASLGTYHPRMMAFNGVEAATNCDCTIHAILHANENFGQAWDFNDSSGTEALGHEGSLEQAPEVPDFPDTDWTLEAGWFDPRPRFPLLWGAPPSGDTPASPPWGIQTQYRPASVYAPAYRAATGPGGTGGAVLPGPTGYRNPGGGGPT